MTLDNNAEIVHSKMCEDGRADSQKVGFNNLAQKVETGMDVLWDSDKWSDEKNEEVLKEHLRTHYKKKKIYFFCTSHFIMELL